MLTVFASQASLIVANALLLNELQVDNKRLHERLEQYRFGEIVGTSAADAGRCSARSRRSRRPTSRC